MNLVARIALIAMAVLMASVGAFAFFSERAASQELSQAMQSRSGAIAKGLAIQLERILQYGIVLENIEGFDEQLQEAVENYEGLSYAYVTDTAGRTLFRYHKPGAARAGKVADESRFLNVQAGVGKGGTLAKVVVGYRADLVAQRLARAQQQSLFIALAVFLAGVVLLVTSLRVFVQRPLDVLGRIIGEVRRGENPSVRMKALGPLEFRSVAASFNLMLDDLQRREGELRQSKQEADQANAAKSLFMAKMSHELRTPMHGVLGMVDMLRHTPLSERQHRFAAAAERSGQAMLEIINDLLDYAKVEAGRMELEQEPLDLAEVVRDAVTAVEPQARAKGLRLLADLDPALPAQVWGDALRLRQVVWNLLSNAVKFTDAGEVRLRADALADGRLRIAVMDTGIGMTPDMVQRVFEPFTQADNSIARRFGGTGLGLTIAREIAQVMGGTIEASSLPGEGSSFTLTWPACLQPPAAKAEEPSAALPPPATLGVDPAVRPRLLVVDDNALNREVIEAMLGDGGFELTLAFGGEEALALCRERVFDLVLMDCSMPGMDGYQATQALRDLEASAGRGRTPVIALTGNVAADARQRCLAAGMDDYLTKPCVRARLLATVGQWLSGAAEPPAEPAAQVLDCSALEALAALQAPGKPDLVVRALELFDSEMARLLAQARAASQDSDRSTLERAVHTMATVCLNVGATAPARLCRELEALQLPWSPAAVAAGLDRIQQLADEAAQGLRQWSLNR